MLGLGAILSNVDEVIEQKASRESKSKAVVAENK